MVVAAADEVVWSCFLPALQANESHPDLVNMATPLPYVETYYTPRAFMVEDPPRELKFYEDQEFFEQCLETMPIALVGMPTVSLHNPWSLISLSHEVGHHVQHMILPNQRLVKKFAELLQNAVETIAQDNAIPCEDKCSDRWYYWGEEIFADLYAITQLGEAAAWSIHEYIWTDTDGMWTQGSLKYPCPGVRQAILKHACDILNIDADPAYGAWRSESPTADDEDAAIDLKLAKEVVTCVLAAEPAGCASLESIASSSLPSLDNVKIFSEQLADPHGVNPDRGEIITREIMSGGVRAFANLADANQKLNPETRRQHLVKNLPNGLIQTRRSKIRAEEPEISTDKAKNAFWDLLES
jgi:hypothetical protein